ncbi:MAG: FAD/NAD(P)-binding protein [Brevundimonas sp.]|uniref:FAD/NAD(P)-binding protein n=1 Tax=Brevundimonas sp. TaxID=1871086 RepID=UPI003919B05C
MQSFAVIGAGFSGLLTAIHLLRSPQTQVTLIERSTSFATGAAYATGNPDHLLNVRLGNMSAFPDQPNHLIEWLATHSQWTLRDGFITRGVYGEYLRSLLAEAMANEGSGDRLTLLRGEAVDLAPRPGGWSVVLDDGFKVEADSAVLALGNIEPMTPPGITPALEETWRYVGDPWRAAASLPSSAHRVLMIGSGLTMVDVAMSLRMQGRKLLSISRRGLLPRTHGAAPDVSESAQYAGSPIQVLRQARRQARTREWRDVVDEVRRSARGLWREWSPGERASILRHLRPHWDVHRHRLSTMAAGQIHQMIAAGDLAVLAGRVVSLDLEGDAVTLTWRPRGSQRTATRRLDAVVNCTGPLGEIRQSRSPLIRNLLARELVTPDPNGLGIHVNERCEPLTSSGEPTPSLHAVGPLTRGTVWEITSVPDLRIQAAEVAAHATRRKRA